MEERSNTYLLDYLLSIYVQCLYQDLNTLDFALER